MLLCHFKFSFKKDKLNFRFIGTLISFHRHFSLVTTTVFDHFRTPLQVWILASGHGHCPVQICHFWSFDSYKFDCV